MSMSWAHVRFMLERARGLLDLRRLAAPIARGELRPDSPLAPYLVDVARVQESTSLADLLPLQAALLDRSQDRQRRCKVDRHWVEAALLGR